MWEENIFHDFREGNRSVGEVFEVRYLWCGRSVFFLWCIRAEELGLWEKVDK